MEEKIAQLQAEKLELENKFLDPDFLKSKDYLEIQKKYNKISEIIETYQKSVSYTHLTLTTIYSV